jgi:hypothetical protein
LTQIEISGVKINHLATLIGDDFIFLLHITITVVNCNSSISDVGGKLLPRLSEQALLVQQVGHLFL